MKKIITYLILIGVLVVNGCHNNNNMMMGNSRNNNNSNNNSSKSAIAGVVCNSVNRDCISNISAALTQAQQDAAKLKCSDAYTICLILGGASVVATNK